MDVDQSTPSNSDSDAGLSIDSLDFPELVKPNARIIKLNQEVISGLQAALKQNPEMDLLAIFPKDYAERRRGKRPTSTSADREYKKLPPPSPVRPPAPLGQGDFCENVIALSQIATVIDPLSDEATAFLASFLEPRESSQALLDPERLMRAIKRMLAHPEKLWEDSIRGVVLKCNDDLAVKVVRGYNDPTEYTSMQYLAEHAPDIPAPKPHGFIKLGTTHVIFLTLIPSVTLEKVWADLTDSNKTTIQHELNEIFLKLRKLKKNTTQRLGGLGGEGVKNDFMFGHRSSEVMTTASEFEDFQFSACPRASKAWVTFLRSFLPTPSEECVFTHGDVWMANIMVKLDDNSDRYTVSGLIDWESSGFYPESQESILLPSGLTRYTETDWHAYAPPCISAKRYPVHWLVHRLWRHTVDST
ncbi:hypothetical protein VE03_07786 [Pseudogymnoascus sp. 23342-1-I1]|nr:hypothetical protein VE03_07786 [Pseudogymnoascus sp. 23342-1-I1]